MIACIILVLISLILWAQVTQLGAIIIKFKNGLDKFWDIEIDLQNRVKVTRIPAVSEPTGHSILSFCSLWIVEESWIHHWLIGLRWLHQSLLLQQVFLRNTWYADRTSCISHVRYPSACALQTQLDSFCHFRIHLALACILHTIFDGLCKLRVFRLLRGRYLGRRRVDGTGLGIVTPAIFARSRHDAIILLILLLSNSIA